jgi:hypothetical protein
MAMIIEMRTYIRYFHSLIIQRRLIIILPSGRE